MNKELSIAQAQALLDYLKNSSGNNSTNFEILCGLILCFSVQYLEATLEELKKK